MQNPLEVLGDLKEVLDLYLYLHLLYSLLAYIIVYAPADYHLGHL